jgi:hypothetical protein
MTFLHVDRPKSSPPETDSTANLFHPPAWGDVDPHAVPHANSSADGLLLVEWPDVTEGEE